MVTRWIKATGSDYFGWFLMVDREDNTTAYAAYMNASMFTYVTYTYGTPKTKQRGPQPIPAEIRDDIEAAKRYVETMWRLQP